MQIKKGSKIVFFEWGRFVDYKQKCLRNDERNGEGIYYFKNGDVFTGTWQDGKQTGEGSVGYSNGNLLRGVWSNGKRSGKFYFTFPNGERFSAVFKDGLREGGWTKIDPVSPNLSLLNRSI